MEEMKTILDNSTENTLAIIDELGRGTSTFDGYAIAVGCLSALFILKCKVIFATHYYFISDDIREFEKMLSYKKMDFALVDA
jgi:DNA mismatch repair ATPase MutS